MRKAEMLTFDTGERILGGVRVALNLPA